MSLASLGKERMHFLVTGFSMITVFNDITHHWNERFEGLQGMQEKRLFLDTCIDNLIPEMQK